MSIGNAVQLILMKQRKLQPIKNIYFALIEIIMVWHVSYTISP